MMQKILYITNGINGAGGLERVLSIKASYFAELPNYQVSILSLNKMDDNPFYGFSPKINLFSIDVGGNPIQYIQEYRKGIQKTVDTVQPDIILVCDDGLKAFFIPQFLKTNAKIIYERHVSKLIEQNHTDSLQKKISTKIKWKLMETLGKKFHKFVVLTEGNKKEWPTLDNMAVIANPLSFYPKESAELDNKVVICVGKISYQKGQDILAKAWELVHAKHPDWQLHLYGKENLNILDTNQLKNNIHFFLPEKNIQQKYLDSSIYVMSSRFEGFGMVLIEAMACGVPCVSFNCDYGPSDIITDNVDGFIVEQENIQQLSEKLLKLIEDRQLRLAFGEKAKQNVLSYDIVHIAKQWQQLFNKA